MRKRIIVVALAALVIVSALLASGCNGTLKMLMGRWKLMTVGDQFGANQQQYPLPVSVDIYPDHTIKLLDSPLGTWTMDRNTFTFKDTEGTMDISGSFLLEYVTSTSSSDGSSTTVPQLTVYVDGQPVSYVLQKTADLGPLQSYLRAQASASAAAEAATPAPATASPDATSAK